MSISGPEPPPTPAAADAPAPPVAAGPSSAPLLVSGAEVCWRLGSRHALNTRQARRALAAGLVGEPVYAGSRPTYDHLLLHELLAWEPLTVEEVDAACPGGVFIGRLGVGRAFHVRDAWSVASRAAGAAWRLPELERFWLVHHLPEAGGFPFVATLSDYVVLGGEIRDVEWVDPPRNGRGRARRGDLVLEEPGPWFEAFRHRRIRLGAGHPYHLRGTPWTRTPAAWLARG